MSKLRLLKSTGVYTVLGFIPLVTSFFLLPINIKYMTLADYGLVLLAMTTQTYLVILTVFGLNKTLAVYYFDYLKMPGGPERLLSQILSSLVVAALLFSGILWLAGDWLFDFFWDGNLSFSRFGWFIFLNSLFVSLNQVLYQYYRVAEDLKKAVLITMLPFVFTMAGGLIGIIYFKLGAMGNIGGRSIGFVAVSIPFYLQVFRKYGFHLKFSALKPLYIHAFPIMVFTMIGNMAETADRFILNKYFDLATVGTYGLAAVIVSTITIFLNSYWNSVTPTMYRNLSVETNHPRINDQYFKLLLLITLITSWGLMLVIEPVVQFYTKPSYHTTTLYVPLLIVGTFARAYYMIYSFHTFYYKKTVWLPVVNVVSLAIGVIFSLLLVHPMGVWGVVVGTLLAKIAQSVMSYVIEARMGFYMYSLKSQWVLVVLTVGISVMNNIWLYPNERVNKIWLHVGESLFMLLLTVALNWKMLQTMIPQRYLPAVLR